MGSTPGSARTIIPPISIVIALQPFAVGAGNCLMAAFSPTGTNAGASSIRRISWPARAVAPDEQMLRRDIVTACHLRHHGAGRTRFRDEPPPGLVAPAASAANQPENQLAPAAPKRQLHGQRYVRTHPFFMVRMLQLSSGLVMCGDNGAYN
jgi:hypothetical protein